MKYYSLDNFFIRELILKISSRFMLLNQHTTDKMETFFAPAEQYVYSHNMNRHIRSGECLNGIHTVDLAERYVISDT